MNNEVKNVPSLRFPGFIDEWKTVKLGDIAKFSKGAGISKADINQDGDREAIRYGELYTTYGEVVTNVHSKVVSKPSDILSDANDVLIPSSGETAIDISTATYVGKSGVAIGGDLNIVKTDENGKFLSYYFNHKKRIDIAKLAQGVSVVHLYGSDLKTLKVNLPSEEEQEKIADFFTAVDERIELASLKVEKLETYKRGLTQKIFTRTLRFKRDDGSDFPDWVDERMRYVVKKNSLRNRDGLIKHVESVSNKHGFVRQEDYFSDRSVASQDTSNYFVIKQGMFAYNPSRINVGSLAYKFDSQTSIVSPLYVSFSAEKNKLTDLFLLNWFFTEDFIRQRDRSFEGSVRDTLSFESLGRMRIMLPCLEEQQKIATFLSQIDEKITLETGKLEELKKFKKALLQRMFA